MKNTIKAVALGIHNLIKNRRGHSFYQHSEGDLHTYDDADRQMLANLEIFDERAHPLTVSPWQPLSATPPLPLGPHIYTSIFPYCSILSSPFPPHIPPRLSLSVPILFPRLSAMF